MFNAAMRLTQQCFTIYSTSATDEKKQEARSDALWAWIMITQSAANADDNSLYQHSLAQMTAITRQ
jgi:hypothetical protein